MRPGWRLAGLGFFFLALLSVLTLRLWFLQVTEGQAFELQAETQQIRVLSTPAPRGEILDRNGVLLAGTRVSLGVVVDRALLSDESEEAVIQRLSSLLEIAPVELRAAFSQTSSRGRVTVATDISDADALFIREHAEDFPGVVIEQLPERIYPAGQTAAHVVGYIGRPGESDLEREDIGPNDVVGKFGVEREYDERLRGTSGWIAYRVDARGDILSVTGEQPPVPGGTLVLTIDTEIQDVLELALANGLELARREGEPAIRAAGVVIDPRNGGVYAMASVPSFEPQIFVGGLTQTEWQAQNEKGAFNNFAIQGVFPPASTFKAVAYAMALEEGIYPNPAEAEALLADTDKYFCDGLLEFQFQDGSQQVFADWKPEGHSAIDLHDALQQSCDLYFWELALRVWRGRNDLYDEDLIQQWARRLGFGDLSGIDLPFEAKGLIGDRVWFERAQRESPGRVRSEPYAGGDVMNIVIGQGLATATPLQVANAYATLVNGGTLWRPQVVDKIIDQNGDLIFDQEPVIQGKVDLDPQTVAFLKQDLRLAVNGPAGTARVAFEDFGPERVLIGGKTGTAEIDQDEDIDTAWFVGVAPIDNPRYVVAVVIDQGGSGGRIAAPTARQILEFLLKGELPERIEPGEDAD